MRSRLRVNVIQGLLVGQTHGESTSNNGFALSDGANLVLTTGVEMDRTGKVYSEGLRPDVELPEEQKISAERGIDQW